MAASFNASGDGSKTPLVPATSGYLLSAVVLTRAAEPGLREMRFAFPGVPGAATIYFGMAASQIAWQWWLVASSRGNLDAFESIVHSYYGAGRFTLVSETGKTYSNVEVRGYKVNDPPDVIVGTSNWLRTGVVTFERMQPGI